jgi:hypothetical protein
MRILERALPRSAGMLRLRNRCRSCDLLEQEAHRWKKTAGFTNCVRTASVRKQGLLWRATTTRTSVDSPFTSLSMRMQKEARAHLRTYCPTREPRTGISNHQGSSQCSARAQWKNDRAAYTQHAVGASIFVIEPLHQPWGQQSSPRQLRALLALCSRSSITPYHKRIPC